MNPHMMQNPFLNPRGTLGAQGHMGQAMPSSNPFQPAQDEGMVRKEKMAQAEQKTPWMQRPGMFGVNRQQALMGGLGLLAGMY